MFIFSIWYWIIDPPGIEDEPHEEAPWAFLFPQRGSQLPHYGSWSPGYADYLFIGFTTNFAFSPTDALPLTRTAKMLMLLQGGRIGRDRHWHCRGRHQRACWEWMTRGMQWPTSSKGYSLRVFRNAVSSARKFFRAVSDKLR